MQPIVSDRPDEAQVAGCDVIPTGTLQSSPHMLSLDHSAATVIVLEPASEGTAGTVPIAHPHTSAIEWQQPDPHPEYDTHDARLMQTPAPIAFADLKTQHTSIIRPVNSDVASLVPTVARPEPVPELRFPVIGEDFASFRIVEELGRGGFGRVYLAEEWRLAGRKVVLKITTHPSNESQRLARLQHTNIVPIQNAFKHGDLYAIQMPYYGRQTLSDLLLIVRECEKIPAVGGRVFSSTVARQTTSVKPGSRPFLDPFKTPSLPFLISQEPFSPEEQHPLRDTLANWPYVNSVLWIGARLAEGLAHAHTRNILHLDLKPQNVLFSDDGQPMLLDFNLGYDQSTQDRERIGGTWPYMAPEQIEEYINLPGVKVDERTDLYSLGVLLFELLTGKHPFPATRSDAAGLKQSIAVRKAGAPSVRERNPIVPHAVDSIIRKLLDPDPAARYQSADEVRTDLELQLDDRPLRHAPNTSLRERVSKWWRRNPRLPADLMLTGAVLAVAGMGIMLNQAMVTHTEVQARESQRELASVLPSLRVDLTSPSNVEIRQHAIQSAEAWFQRYPLVDATDQPENKLVRGLSTPARGELSQQLGELALLVAHAEWLNADAVAPAQQRRSLANAIRWNQHAEAWFRQSTIPDVLWIQRSRLAQASADSVLEATIPQDRATQTPTRVDLFLQAATHVAQGEYTAAVQPLLTLTDQEKDHFAAHFVLAYSYHQTSHWQRALERYLMARALSPADARPGYNRGLIYLHLRENQKAEAEFADALLRDPAYADCYWHRALARRRLGNAQGAIDDLTTGMNVGVSRVAALLLRAELFDQLGQKGLAQEDRHQLESLKPETERDFVMRGLSRLWAKDYKGSLADFDAAIRVNPHSLMGWQNRAMVLGDYLHDTAGALEAQSTACKLYPEYAPARSAQAILLARLGHRHEAHKQAAQAALLTSDPKTIYQVSCVYAITGKTHPEDRNQALQYLREAFRNGFREFTILESDPDIRSLKSLSEYQQALDAAKVLTR